MRSSKIFSVSQFSSTIPYATKLIAKDSLRFCIILIYGSLFGRVCVKVDIFSFHLIEEILWYLFKQWVQFPQFSHVRPTAQDRPKKKDTTFWNKSIPFTVLYLYFRLLCVILSVLFQLLLLELFQLFWFKCFQILIETSEICITRLMHELANFSKTLQTVSTHRYPSHCSKNLHIPLFDPVPVTFMSPSHRQREKNTKEERW